MAAFAILPKESKSCLGKLGVIARTIRRKRSCSSFRKVCLFFAGGFFAAVVMHGNAQLTNTDQVGILPYGTYEGGTVDQVNMTNGSLTVKIPLYSLPQKGSLALSMSVAINSASVTVSKDCETNVPATIDQVGTKNCTVQYAVSTPLARIQIDQQLNLLAGPYYNLFSYTGCSLDYGSGTEDNGNYNGPWPGESDDCITWDTFVAEYQHMVTDSTGAQHYLAYDQSTNFSTLRSVDGSGIQENTGDSNSYWDGATGPLYDSSGNKYQYNSQGTYTITDPNNNVITIDASGNVTDSLGRQFSNYSIKTDISSCPVLNYPNQTLTKAYVWNLPGPADAPNKTIPIIFCYASVNINTGVVNGDGTSTYGITSTEYLDNNNLSYNVTTDYLEWVVTEANLQSIVLPDNTYWAFSYDSAATGQSPTVGYGSLLSIKEPLGGTITYGTPVAEIPCVAHPDPNFYELDDADGYSYYPFSLPYRKRTVSNGSVSGVWTYDFAEQGDAAPQSTAIDPNGNETVHHFAAIDSCQFVEDWTKTYDGAASPSKTPRQTVNKMYSTIQSPSYNGVNEGLPLIGPRYIPTLVSESVTLDNGVATTTTYSHGATFAAGQTSCAASNGGCNPIPSNQVSTTTMNLGLLTGTSVSGDDGAGGTVTRSTTTDYEALDNQNYYLASLFNLPSTITVSGTGGNGTTTTYGYDDPTLSPGGYRGNRTSISTTGPDGGQTSATTGYNSSGQVTSDIDAASHVTSYTYGDPLSSSPTKVTYPAINGSQQTESYTWDANTGVMTSHTDRNGVLTKYSHSDSLGRLSLIDAAVGTTAENETKYDYSVANTVKMSGDFKTLGDGLLTSSTVADGLGRPVATIDAAGNETATTYDPSGNVESVSNPFASGGSPADLTTYAYDSLGRKIMQCQPDNGGSAGAACTAGASYLQWQISGNQTVSQDEAGVQSRQTADALGRLVRVDELGNSSTPMSLSTTYTYDILGNLTGVSQNGTSGDTARTRSFNYDSLSRLLSSTNPETGTISYSYLTNGALCAGDVTLPCSKTDARGVTTTYTDDALNRLTGKTYNDGVTPQAIYVYDQTSFNFFPNPRDPTRSLSLPQQNTIGRLAVTCVVGVQDCSTAEAISYDPMGRIINRWATAPSYNGGGSPVFSISASYDLAGHRTDLTYPSGRHIHQTWDSAGRLSGINLADVGGTPPTPAMNYLTSATYFADGAPDTLTFGNGMAQSWSENNRFQTTGISVSPVPSSPFGTTTFLSHSYCYSNCTTGGLKNNGNIWGITDNLNGTRSQGFTYDALNRITSFSLGGVLNQQYTIDSFGNMSPLSGANSVYTFDPATNRVNNLPCRSVVQAFDAAGNQTCWTDENGYVSQNTYDGESRISSMNAYGSSTPFESYSYDVYGMRIRKSNVAGAYTEYVYFDGEPVAEHNSDGTWSDYIFANGKRIARSDNFDVRIHLSGTNCNGCGSTNTYAGSSSMTSLVGYTIRSGDKISWRQYQDGPASGGITLSFSNGPSTIGWPDQNGIAMDADTVSGNWHSRIADLSAFAGQTMNFGVTPWNTGGEQPGNWDIYFGDIAIVNQDGTVIPIYDRTLGGVSPTFSGPAVSNFIATTEDVPNNSNPNTTNSLISTTFYLGDHLGTTSMLASAGGWPLISNQFMPFGTEINSDNSPNSYKFTGKERDAESGNDYFGARYYASNMGRFMSPDPSNLSFANPNNPQSLNLYAYAANSPLLNTDPTGLDCVSDNGDGTASINSGDCSGKNPNGEYYYDCGSSGDGCLMGTTSAYMTANGALALMNGNTGTLSTISGYGGSVAGGGQSSQFGNPWGDALFGNQGLPYWGNANQGVQTVTKYAAQLYFGAFTLGAGAFGSGITSLGLEVPAATAPGFGTAAFGTAMHAQFGDVLLEQTGTVAEDWRFAAPNAPGVDATYLGNQNLGFGAAELKPFGYDMNAVGNQIGSFSTQPGTTSVWWYNSNGIIGNTGWTF